MNSTIFRKTIIVIAWLSVWQIVSLIVNDPIILVGPIETVYTLFLKIGDNDFLLSVAWSLLRISIGFILAFVIAIVLSFLAYKNKLLADVLSPIITLMKTVPVASVVILLLIWFGSEWLTPLIIFAVVFPIIYVNTLEGFNNVPIKMLEMCRVFKVGLKPKFMHIYRPNISPFVLSGIKLAVGMAFKSGVAAEVIGVPRFSIGEGMYMSKIYFDTASVLAWTLCIIILSVLFEKIILAVVNSFLKTDSR